MSLSLSNIVEICEDEQTTDDMLRVVILEIIRIRAEKMRREALSSIARTQHLLDSTSARLWLSHRLEQTWHDSEEKKIKTETWYTGDIIDRTGDSPAIIEYAEDGSVTSETWYHDGDKTKKRELRYNPDGERVTYYKDDKLNRVDGPAEITWVRGIWVRELLDVRIGICMVNFTELMVYLIALIITMIKYSTALLRVMLILPIRSIHVKMHSAE